MTFLASGQQGGCDLQAEDNMTVRKVIAVCFDKIVT